MGSSLQDLAGALLIIFKTNLSVTGSKVSKGFQAKEVSGQAVVFYVGVSYTLMKCSLQPTPQSLGKLECQ